MSKIERVGLLLSTKYLFPAILELGFRYAAEFTRGESFYPVSERGKGAGSELSRRMNVEGSPTAICLNLKGS